MQQAQFLIANACRNTRPIKSTYIEVTFRSTAENKSNLAFASYFVKEPEAFDFVSSLIFLASPSLKNIDLMNLAIMATYLLLVEVTPKPIGIHIARDAKGIIMVGLANVILITQELCYIPIGDTNL